MRHFVKKKNFKKRWPVESGFPAWFYGCLPFQQRVFVSIQIMFNMLEIVMLFLCHGGKHRNIVGEAAVHWN